MTKADALEVRIYIFRMVTLLVMMVVAAVSVIWLVPTIQPAQVVMIAIFAFGFATLVLTKFWTMEHTLVKVQRVLDLIECGVDELNRLRNEIRTISTARAKQLDEIQMTCKATFTLSNTQYGTTLQSLANVQSRLAEKTGSEADKVAADRAIVTARDHEAKQALVAVTVPVTLPATEAAAAVVAAADAGPILAPAAPVSTPETDPNRPAPASVKPVQPEGGAGTGADDPGAEYGQSGAG